MKFPYFLHRQIFIFTKGNENETLERTKNSETKEEIRRASKQVKSVSPMKFYFIFIMLLNKISGKIIKNVSPTLIVQYFSTS